MVFGNFFDWEEFNGYFLNSFEPSPTLILKVFDGSFIYTIIFTKVIRSSLAGWCFHALLEKLKIYDSDEFIELKKIYKSNKEGCLLYLCTKFGTYIFLKYKTKYNLHKIKPNLFDMSSETLVSTLHRENFMAFFTTLTRKVSQVSLTDFNDSLICCRASKNKTHVIFFIGGKTVLGGEIDP